MISSSSPLKPLGESLKDLKIPVMGDMLLYSSYFWNVAKNTEYYSFLKDELRNFGENEKANDTRMEAGLLALAAQERDREDNYYNKYIKYLYLFHQYLYVYL